MFMFYTSTTVFEYIFLVLCFNSLLDSQIDVPGFVIMSHIYNFTIYLIHIIYFSIQLEYLNKYTLYPHHYMPILYQTTCKHFHNVKVNMCSYNFRWRWVTSDSIYTFINYTCDTWIFWHHEKDFAISSKWKFSLYISLCIQYLCCHCIFAYICVEYSFSNSNVKAR